MISIIIPVFNEAGSITKLLDHLCANASGHIKEIIIADGGSADNTIGIIQDFLSEGYKDRCVDTVLINTEKGRARQMNAGAQHASGKVLYFLHADTLPPPKFDSLIMQEVQQGNPAGCFRMRFDNNHWWLRLASWLTKFSWRACRGGDQSQFITRKLFDEIGGYDESYIIYEDNILINELYSRKKFVVIQNKILSSARLYEEKGIGYLQYHFWMIYVKKWLGAGPDELLDYYIKKIKRECAPPALVETAKETESKKVYAD